MRLIGIVTGTLLLAIVVAEGAYLVKTRRQVETLTAELRTLRRAREDAPPPRWRTADDARDREGAPGPGAGWPGPGGRPLPPPRFAEPAPPSGTAASPTAMPAPGGGPPLPAAIDTPEAREQMRQFIAAELGRERDQDRDRRQQQREEAEQRRLQETAKTLGLNPDETRRFAEIVASAQTARRDLRDKIESGQIARADLGREFRTMREKTDGDLRAVLGEDRMKKYDDMRRQDRGGPMGGAGPGGFFEGFRARSGPGGPGGSAPAAAPATGTPPGAGAQ